jgi:hypothetical protein
MADPRAGSVHYTSLRVKFADFRFERTADGRCRAEVELLAPVSGSRHRGVEEAVGDQPAGLRCVAQATLKALEGAIEHQDLFEILGVKAIKAFDTVVVLVAMSAKRDDELQRLVGSYLATDDPERGAALAVLNATNRYLGNTIFTR